MAEIGLCGNIYLRQELHKLSNSPVLNYSVTFTPKNFNIVILCHIKQKIIDIDFIFQ